jgi:phosphoribosylformylglycinamidine cyclo-ligase
MISNRDLSFHTAYRESGVDTDEAVTGLSRLIRRIRQTWPAPGEFGAVQLDIGYFANVVAISDETGLAICTDGVGTKAIIAREMHLYDTIGIDCVAMNVNDLICLGARPVSLVDYIAIDEIDADILDSIAIGLTKGARQAGISISGGEIAQLKDIVNGFDLAGTAVGTVPLKKIITGRHLEPGDYIVGIGSSGIHSNGLTLARKAFFKRAQPLSLSYTMPETGITLGDELLRPTFIYVPEVMEILKRVSDVKALVNITSDGFLNLNRVHNEHVSFEIDNLPEVPEIFKMIKQYGGVGDAEMFEVYNMGVGFCVIVSEPDVSTVLSILGRHDRKAWVIGRVAEGKDKAVRLKKERLVGYGKRFQSQ